MLLHILLLILKVLGIAILVVIGLVLLGLVVLVLTPLRYQIRASAHGSFSSVKADGRISWFFHLISGEFSYAEGTLRWKMRAAWKQFSDGDDGAPESPHGVGVKSPKAESSRAAGGRPPKIESPHAAGGRPPKAESLHGTGKKPPEADSPHGAGEKSPKPEKPAAAGIQAPEARREPAKQQSSQKTEEKSFYEKWTEKIRKKIEKIKYTFRQFCGKIKALMRRKERLQKFIENEVHRKAFSRAVREAKRFLGFLRPEKLEAEIVFGLEDPAETGYILALISMIYPLIGEYTVIRPDFDNQVLKGKLEAAGKIRLLYGLVPAWNLVWDKNVRITFRHIKKFRF